MDFLKEHLVPKSFSIAAYTSVILHFFFGAIFSVIAGDIRNGEKQKFSCNVDKSKDKAYIESSCFGMYDDLINGPLPLYGFILLSFGLHGIVSVVYSLMVKSRVGEIVSSLEKDENVENSKSAHELRERRSIRKGFSVFSAYILYLTFRFVLGALCNVLQYAVLFPLSFPTNFPCNIQRDETSSNSTCKNLTASEKTTWGVVVFIVNVLFAATGLVEILFLLVNEFSRGSTHFSNCDEDFIGIHFLRTSCNQRHGEAEDVPLLQILPSVLDAYKDKILRQILPVGISYGQNSFNSGINDIFVDLIIHTGRAKHDILKKFGRHEIDDVYYELPQNSIPLHQVEDMFKPNTDTKDEFPRTILVVGRPGIGKTVLCEKIKNDWASKDLDLSSFYEGKVVFFFKFRWFNSEDSKFSLKSFLNCGIQGDISSEQFDAVFQHICQTSENAIFIFDGLDESNANFKHIMDNVDLNFGDDDISPAAFFVKLVLGQLLPKASILVTSRATADHVYSELRFQRQVEVLGFTRDKIEEYVEKFCSNHDQLEKKDMIINFIKSNVEIHNLCYIPVNCFIVCSTLLGYLVYPDSFNIPLPTTLTELYEAAVLHLQRNHERNEEKFVCPDTLCDLQELAFRGVKNRLLIFDSKLLDNDMEESSLLHRLSNPIFPSRYQYCFIHLTVQEFLAAQYIVERKTAHEICEFVESNLEDGNWRLVLQFVAGLLGEKMKLTCKYSCCVDVFTSRLWRLGSGFVEERDVAILKCLKEFKNESVVKKAASEMLGNKLEIDSSVLMGSDWAALTMFLKWAVNVKCLTIERLSNDEIVVELAKILQERCFESLSFGSLHLEDSSWLELFSGLTTSSCELNHQHCPVKKLKVTLSDISDSGMMHLSEFLKSESSRNLEELIIAFCHITSKGVATLCESLSSPEVGNLLTSLDLTGNPLGDEGLPFMCEIYRKKYVKITDVRLRSCNLTNDCMSSMCELLNEEYFKCTELDIEENHLGDKAVKVLHDNLIKEQTELQELNLSICELTSECMPLVSSLLKEKFFNVVRVFLSKNEIGDKGAEILFRSLATKHLTLKELHLTSCGLTDGCMPALCELLKDEHCNLEHMDIRINKITDTYIPQLCDVFRGRHFDRELTLRMANSRISEQGKSSLHRCIGANVVV